MPIDQSKTAISIPPCIVDTHLISLIAPVWSKFGMSTLSPYLLVNAVQIVATVAYKVFIILFPICINLTVSRNAVLSMLGCECSSLHSGNSKTTWSSVPSITGRPVVYSGIAMDRPMYGAHRPSCTTAVQNVTFRWGSEGGL